MLHNTEIKYIYNKIDTIAGLTLGHASWWPQKVVCCDAVH